MRSQAHLVTIARACAEVMWTDDAASRGLGMQLGPVGPGSAVLTMEVTEAMVNGLGICHGGFIFSLADSACAFASNSYNQRMVLQSGQITLLAPARLGMHLEAEAVERHKAERSAIYDVTVRGTSGVAIAEFRGHVRSIPGTLVADAR
ncbi:MAG: hydroxyphenylacetyl-CoA thioesterase PaaI [Hyphomicrobiaceae bacterium]